MDMGLIMADVGVIVTLCALTFGFGVWFNRISNHLGKIDNTLAPLVILHKEQIISYYLEKGIMPNPGMTPRMEELIKRLKAGTITPAESQELARALDKEKKEARNKDDEEAVVAILALLGLLWVLSEIGKK